MGGGENEFRMPPFPQEIQNEYFYSDNLNFPKGKILVLYFLPDKQYSLFFYRTGSSEFALDLGGPHVCSHA
ncbi:hypothetical protein D3C83_157440 [compost metagenome]